MSPVSGDCCARVRQRARTAAIPEQPGSSVCRYGSQGSLTRAYLPDVQLEAEVDEQQPDELGHVQHLDISHAGECAADAWQDRADRDADVAEIPVSLVGLPAIPYRRHDGAAYEEDRGVRVDERAEQANVLPTQRPA